MPRYPGISDVIPIAHNMTVQVQPDETWKTHPQGGIVVESPSGSRWVRMEGDKFIEVKLPKRSPVDFLRDQTK